MAADIITHWLSLLPINHDMEEGYQQYDILAEMFQADPAYIMGPDNRNLQQVIKIFADVLDAKYL